MTAGGLVARVNRETALRALCALFGVMPVLPLLVWVYGLAPFSTMTVAVALPAVLALFAIAFVASGSASLQGLWTAIGCGVVGGLIGTLAYDLVRVPQTLVGLRPYVPIESYGVLALNAQVSSPLTTMTGWFMNFANGLGFGIAYSCLALGRRWYWAIPWAMFLESTTVVSPYAEIYGLAGKWDLIGMAYFAHLFYAYPLGRVVEAGAAFMTALALVVRHAVPLALGAVAVALVAWHHPFPLPALDAPLMIREGQFAPYWVRLAPGDCVNVTNADAVEYRIPQAQGAPAVAAGATARLCFTKPGITRARTSNAPDAGGIVLVDREMSR